MLPSKVKLTCFILQPKLGPSPLNIKAISYRTPFIIGSTYLHHIFLFLLNTNISVSNSCKIWCNFNALINFCWFTFEQKRDAPPRFFSMLREHPPTCRLHSLCIASESLQTDRTNATPYLVMCKVEGSVEVSVQNCFSALHVTLPIYGGLFFSRPHTAKNIHLLWCSWLLFVISIS